MTGLDETPDHSDASRRLVRPFTGTERIGRCVHCPSVRVSSIAHHIVSCCRWWNGPSIDFDMIPSSIFRSFALKWLVWVKENLRMTSDNRVDHSLDSFSINGESLRQQFDNPRVVG